MSDKCPKCGAEFHCNDTVYTGHDESWPEKVYKCGTRQRVGGAPCEHAVCLRRQLADATRERDASNARLADARKMIRKLANALEIHKQTRATLPIISAARAFLEAKP